MKHPSPKLSIQPTASMTYQGTSSPQLASGSSDHVLSMDPEDDSDNEMDWEEITVPASSTVVRDASESGVTNLPSTSRIAAQAANAGNIEITLKRTKGKRDDEERKKKAEQIAALRALRLTCHKIHTVALISNALARNKWLNDPLLHARLLSILPMSYQTSFSMITKKRHPDPAKRGRLFETAVMRLAEWWHQTFEVLPYGHVKSRTFEQVQKLLSGEVEIDDEGETLRSSKSLMKRVLLAQGSRDVSAQLFTALCRALEIPARLVVSLQSVPWQANVGKPKTPSKRRWDKRVEARKKLKGKPPDSSSSETSDEDESDMEEISIPGPSMDRKGKGKAVFPGEGSTPEGKSRSSSKGKEKALPKPIVKLRKSKSAGRRLDSSPVSQYDSPPPIGGLPPVFWTEVFSKADGRWMAVDPVRYIVNKRRVFEPSQSNMDNRMVYVIAVEEDGYCRDVTPRYAKDYAAKTSKAQLGGKGRRDWWEGVMALVTRPYRLIRDDVEDVEFETNQYREGMPTSVAGFKDHPIYALKQHLKREEVIYPEVELGKFRGEPVYPRGNVIQLKTAENWMRQGRGVKEGEQAMKWVKQRAVTIHRRRAMELAQQEGDEMLQGLYSEAQTEQYVPEPIVDGVVPKNNFGNIDLYTPSMLPAGAAHIPHKGVAKIARRLGFDYAEAVTSFEFKKGRAFPVISGIVVASENEQTILEAFWEAERDAEEKERKKRADRVIKRWARLIQGLRLRQRLQEQYGGAGSVEIPIIGQQEEKQVKPSQAEEQGGFLTEADTVVQPFHLPRFEHSEYHPTLNGVGTGIEHDELADKVGNQGEPIYSSPALPSGSNQIKDSGDLKLGENNDDDDDLDLEEVLPDTFGDSFASAVEDSSTVAVPKSMLDLAKEAETKWEVEALAVSQPVAGPSQVSDGRSIIQVDQKNGRALKGKSNRSTVKGNPSKARKAGTARGKRKLSKQGDKLDEVSTDDESGVNGGSGKHLNVEENKTGCSGRDDENQVNTSLKRKRKVSESAPVTPAPSGRVLRPRAPKTVEKMRAEREAEEAYRNAIAE